MLDGIRKSCVKFGCGSWPHHGNLAIFARVALFGMEVARRRMISNSRLESANNDFRVNVSSQPSEERGLVRSASIHGSQSYQPRYFTEFVGSESLYYHTWAITVQLLRNSTIFYSDRVVQIVVQIMRQGKQHNK